MLRFALALLACLLGSIPASAQNPYSLPLPPANSVVGAINAYTPANIAVPTTPFLGWQPGVGFVDSSGQIAPTGSPPAFFVSTIGNDSAAGSFGAPFLTIQHAITAASSNAVKYIFVRKGTYLIPDSGSACSTNDFGIGLTSGNSGLTIAEYPQDGVDTAILQASGTPPLGICLYNGAHNITIAGLKLVNFVNSGIRVVGGSSLGQGSTGDVFTDNEITGMTGTAYGAGIELIGNVQGTLIEYNYIHDVANRGISGLDNGNSRGLSNVTSAFNVIINTCTADNDCGAVYMQNVTAATSGIFSTGISIYNNYISKVLGDFGIYLDDWMSNVLAYQNVIIMGNLGPSGTSACGMIHAGQNNSYQSNICDLGASGVAIVMQQSDVSGSPKMTNNIWTGNYVVGNGTSNSLGNGYQTLTPNPQAAASVYNNVYHNFGSGTGINITAGTGATTDASPVNQNPELQCYGGFVDRSAIPTSVPFVAPLQTWGPRQPGLGFNLPLPQTGIAPSWGVGC